MTVTTARWVVARPALVFATAAAALVPWIVVLAVTQRGHGTATNITPLRLALVAVIAGLSIAAVALAGRRRHRASVVAAAGAAFALTSAWFDVITRIGLHFSYLVTRLGVWSAVVMATDLVLAVSCLVAKRRAVRWSRVLVVAAVLLFLLEATSIVSQDDITLRVANLQAAWVGLDIGELLGLAATALLLRADHHAVAVVAPATAALLFSDALINVVTSGGVWSVAAALAMAVVELGLGSAAVAVALRSRPRGGRRRN